MDKVVMVMLGGSLGTLARYGVQLWMGHVLGPRLAWGTLLANLSGCFLIGLAFALGYERNLLSPGLRLALMTGFLGAYTTFSTYSLETVGFARQGNWGVALVNILVSNAAGLALVVAGLWAGRLLFKGA